MLFVRTDWRERRLRTVGQGHALAVFTDRTSRDSYYEKQEKKIKKKLRTRIFFYLIYRILCLRYYYYVYYYNVYILLRYIL